jgi:hypothetical protein
MPLLMPAPPQLTGVRKWEWNFQGLTFGGARSVIGVDTVDGLGSPNIRVSTNPKLSAHGALVYARFLDPRTLVFQGTIFGASDSVKRDQIQQIDLAFTPSDVDAPLYFKMGDGNLRFVNCRPTRFAYDGDSGLARGVVNWAAEFIAGDPRIYDSTQQIISIESPPAEQPGHGFDHGFDLGFGGTVGGYAQAENEGTFGTLPIVTIHGPATNPFIRHVDQDLSMDLTITLGSADYLVLDFAARTIKINGTDSSRYYALEPGSVWWEILPGANLIQYGGGGTADVAFRSAWRAA